MSLFNLKKLHLFILSCFFLLGSMTHGKNGGWKPNPKNTQIFQGEVVSVQKFSFANRPASHIQLILKTAKKTYPVDIGPSWYLEAEGLTIYPNDLLTIKGFLIKMNGKEVVLAESIQKGRKALQIRDSKGNPIWNLNPLFTRVRYTS